MTSDTRALTTKSELPGVCSRRRPLLRIAFLCVVLASYGCSPLVGETAEHLAQQEDKSEQDYYKNAHPYLEESLEQLVKQIPELDTIQPAANQDELPTILEKTGKQVDEFFRNIVDVSAHEVIREAKLGKQGRATASFEAEDGYLILRHGNALSGTLEEYRVDSSGNRLEVAGLSHGYFVTSGFALNQNYFATAFQQECKFRYLGDEKIGPRDTYVVAFAQKPGQATITVGMEVQQARRAIVRVTILEQGIAWVDKSNFQIVRLRTDLLAPRQEIGLASETTLETFGEVHLADVPTPLWLPSEVLVNANFSLPNDQLGYTEQNFRNEHRYSDYKTYRVSVKMVPDVPKQPAPGDLRVEEDNSEQLYYANAHPYVEESPEKLAHRIPELRNIQPPDDLQQLPAILKKTGNAVEDFLAQMVDLTAHERITQERVNNNGFKAKEKVQDNYLIVHHSEGNKVVLGEYRTDAQGNRMEQAGLNNGFLVTSGFALSCVFFAPILQQESTFRYLGQQKIGPHDTYVVAFAQKPGHATYYATLTTSDRDDATVRYLQQGVAWVDKSDFQIIRMRTDLLAPIEQIALDTQTTEVTFSKMELRDVAGPLWLPSEVKVHQIFKQVDAKRGKTTQVEYRNDHHYTDYQRFRVSIKMVPSQ